MFDPLIHSVQYRDAGERIIPSSFIDLDNRCRWSNDGTPIKSSLIIIGEVAGPSTNRIIYPSRSERIPGQVYGSNHVTTPVLIHNIIYRGENHDVIEGDVIYVREHFYYVTEETPDALNHFPLNTIISYEYDPMEKNNLYLMYIGQGSSELYNFNYYPSNLHIVARREGVFNLSDPTPQNSAMASVGMEPPAHYARMWHDARAKYGHIADAIRDVQASSKN